MSFEFTKMQGLGNDFVVLDAIAQEIPPLDTESIRFIANRHFGIGCDQILWLKESVIKDADLECLIFNADGSDAEQCGNGMRCIVKYAVEKRLVDGNSVRIQTKSGVVLGLLQKDGQVSVNLGRPKFISNELQEIQYEGMVVSYVFVDVGNPHAVIWLSDDSKYNLPVLANYFMKHLNFSNGVNVGFVQPCSANEINLRVFERGAGETLACGSGACAAAIAGISFFDLTENVVVRQAGGELRITWTGYDFPVLMTGPATRVFEGRWQSE